MRLIELLETIDEVKELIERESRGDLNENEEAELSRLMNIEIQLVEYDED